MITLQINDVYLRFEHSLVSLSEWEQEYEKPFYSSKTVDNRTEKEMVSYFEYMLISGIEYRPLVRLASPEQMLALTHYINKGSTATTVKEMAQKAGPNETPTSELMYYWLVAFKIPFKPTDEWHLHRLLMLVKVCGAKSTPSGRNKVNKRELAMSMREINEQRLRDLGTKG